MNARLCIKMKTIIRAFAFLTLTTAMVPAPSQAKIRVVGTLPDFAAIASEIGGDRVEATSLIEGTQDPHFVDARPSMVVTMNRADLLVCIGMGLEDGWLPVLMTQARNRRILKGKPGWLDASTLISPMEVIANPDRSMGDVHGQGNPHYYTSPREMHKVARGIYERLVELDPAGTEQYERGWKDFSDRWRLREAEWLAALAPLKGTKVVVYHKSWIYLLNWAGLIEEAALEPVPGIPPGPAHVTRLLKSVRKQKIRFVIQEIYHPTSLSKVFASKAGARLLILPSMVGAEKNLRTIREKFDRIIELLVDAG